MKKYITIALSIIIVLLVFISGGLEFPKYAARMPYLIFVVGIEYYIWRSFKDATGKWGRFMRKYFWIPDILLVSFFLVARIIPFEHWIGPLRTYYTGIILIIYLPRLIPLPFLLIKDISRISGKLFHFSLPRFEEGLMNTGLNFSLLVFILLMYGMLFGVYLFKVYDEPIKIDKLPPSLEGMRIVQISDMHLGSWVSTLPLKDAVTDINNLYPDIVLFTGDLVNFTSDEAFRFGDVLKTVKAPLGVYAILGNHDYGDYIHWPDSVSKQRNLDALCQFYKKIGWRLLRNESVVIHKGSDSLLLIGIENWSVKKIYGHRGNVLKAIGNHKSMPLEILLSHDPTHWQYEVSKKFKDINLTLSGHTHGMQMGIETKWFVFSPAQWMYKYWAGLYQNPDDGVKLQYLYVNRGLGHLGYPGRIGMNPEITLITLTNSQNTEINKAISDN
ncbi:MAG: metallophosphoesterase [Bacteroidota bacterium]|nr:metallophosphoesterase [Bacteroidota bacterium]